MMFGETSLKLGDSVYYARDNKPLAVYQERKVQDLNELALKVEQLRKLNLSLTEEERVSDRLVQEEQRTNEQLKKEMLVKHAEHELKRGVVLST